MSAHHRPPPTHPCHARASTRSRPPAERHARGWAPRSGTTVSTTVDCALRGPRGPRRYLSDNLALRWLSGKVGNQRPLTEADLTLAKCRLDGFDFIMDFSLLAETLPALCDSSVWRWKACSRGRGDRPRPGTTGGPTMGGSMRSLTSWPSKAASTRKGVHNDTLYGAFVQRHRLSFDLYDYSRLLAAKHMVQFGLRKTELPPPPPSYVEALVAGGVKLNKHAQAHAGKYLKQRHTGSQARAKHRRACEKIHRKWALNAEGTKPDIVGIGA